MTDYEIDVLVQAANPIGERGLHALDLGDEEQRLCDALTSGDRPGSRRHSDPRRSSGRHRRRLLAGFAVAALVAVGLVVLTGGGEPGTSSAAWAAPLVRLAESSPLILLDEPGWKITRADETDEIEGEMTFTPGSAPVDRTSVADMRRGADLYWRRGSLEDWQRDRASSSSRVVQRTVMGQPAQVAQYAGSDEFTAIWPDGKRVLEFRAAASDLAAFEGLVGSLKRVDVDTWLSAMPASVVKAANRGDAIKQMLADIPLPPRFDISRLEREPTLSDRYQLGARVTGTVTCAWLARWAAARRAGDVAGQQAAVDAMATSRRWKILVEMDTGGGWPEFLWHVADALRDGKRHWPGRAPIERAIGGGMGCNEG